MTQAALVQLQAVDGELDAARKRLRELDQLLAERHILDAADATARAASAVAAERRSQLRDRELELKSLETRIAELDQRLYGGRIRNTKELEGLERESQMFKQHKGKLEEGVLNSMDATERAEGEAQRAQQHADTLRAERARAEQVWGQEIEQLQAQSVEREARATMLRSQADADQLQAYDRLRRRGNLAVVRVRGPDCGACGVSLSQRVIEQARDEAALAQCDSCGRILFYE